MPPEPPVEQIICNCCHGPEDHRDRTGRCTELDSYDCPCACLSYQEMSDD